MNDVASHLGLCWYTENAAFMYAPVNHTKCASPSCGHDGRQRRFDADDRGWGDCSGFTVDKVHSASAAVAAAASPSCAAASPQATAGASGMEPGAVAFPQATAGASGMEPGAVAFPAVSSAAAGDGASNMDRCEVAPLSTRNGFLWGPLRTPREMRAASAQLGLAPWRWYAVLHARHPGDTLVSQFHSFGWTHPPPPDATAAQRRAHAARQAAVRNVSVDEYVVAHVGELRRKYALYTELQTSAPPGVTLIQSRYEQLVRFFSLWLDDWLQALAPSYTAQTMAALNASLLARHAHSFAPDGRHKRSVAPGRFEAELQPRRSASLRRAHGDWWAALGYR